MNPLKVLVVDDSVVYRSVICRAIESSGEFEVVGFVPNGKLCIEKLQQQKVDVVTLDLEMPIMNGLETLKKMNELGFKQDVIMFASPTPKSSDDTIEALALGAIEFIKKPTGKASGESGISLIGKKILPVLKALHRRKMTVVSESEHNDRESVEPHITPLPQIPLETFHPEAIVIGASTGGPGALEQLFLNLSPLVTSPILVTQHMPPQFTHSLAKRLNKITSRTVKEAEDGEVLKQNTIYIAPGGLHMRIDPETQKIALHHGPKRHYVRPSCDELFESASQTFGAKVLCLVLTGMGLDGFDGALAIKQKGGAVMIQNQETSAVFGMPGEIYKSGFYDFIGSIKEIAQAMLPINPERKDHAS